MWATPRGLEQPHPLRLSGLGSRCRGTRVALDEAGGGVTDEPIMLASALHEAGHAAVQLWLELPVEEVSIVSTGLRDRPSSTVMSTGSWTLSIACPSAIPTFPPTTSNSGHAQKPC